MKILTLLILLISSNLLLAENILISCTGDIDAQGISIKYYESNSGDIYTVLTHPLTGTVNSKEGTNNLRENFDKKIYSIVSKFKVKVGKEEENLIIDFLYDPTGLISQNKTTLEVDFYYFWEVNIKKTYNLHCNIYDRNIRF